MISNVVFPKVACELQLGPFGFYGEDSLEILESTVSQNTRTTSPLLVIDATSSNSVELDETTSGWVYFRRNIVPIFSLLGFLISLYLFSLQVRKWLVQRRSLHINGNPSECPNTIIQMESVNNV